MAFPEPLGQLQPRNDRRLYQREITSRGTGPILTKLDTNYPGIGFSFNEGPFFIQRGKELKYY